jgi:hypothetical protein
MFLILCLSHIPNLQCSYFMRSLKILIDEITIKLSFRCIVSKFILIYLIPKYWLKIQMVLKFHVWLSYHACLTFWKHIPYHKAYTMSNGKYHCTGVHILNSFVMPHVTNNSSYCMLVLRFSQHFKQKKYLYTSVLV